MIEEAINNILNNQSLRPSMGDDLLGMDYDVFHAFDSSEVFEIQEVEQTSDKACMFNVRLQVASSVNELHEVRQALTVAWNFIQYPYFESSNLLVSRKNAVFRFVTIIGENQFYVTGKVTVSGSVYEHLAKNA
jgi:hypothetical protein